MLNRIRWDAGFGRGEFEIGFYDRVRGGIVTVLLGELHFAPEEHFAFGFTDADGETHWVPLHRVKKVYKDGQLIWHRSH